MAQSIVPGQLTHPAQYFIPQNTDAMRTCYPEFDNLKQNVNQLMRSMSVYQTTPSVQPAEVGSELPPSPAAQMLNFVLDDNTVTLVGNVIDSLTTLNLATLQCI